MTKDCSITIRVTPIAKYGLELVSRKQHRTLTGVLHWAIEEILKQELPELESLWDFNKTERLNKLQAHAPHLLSYEEKQKLNKG